MECIHKIVESFTSSPIPHSPPSEQTILRFLRRAFKLASSASNELVPHFFVTFFLSEVSFSITKASSLSGTSSTAASTNARSLLISVLRASMDVGTSWCWGVQMLPGSSVASTSTGSVSTRNVRSRVWIPRTPPSSLASRNRSWRLVLRSRMFLYIYLRMNSCSEDQAVGGPRRPSNTRLPP